MKRSLALVSLLLACGSSARGSHSDLAALRDREPIIGERAAEHAAGGLRRLDLRQRLARRRATARERRHLRRREPTAAQRTAAAERRAGRLVGGCDRQQRRAGERRRHGHDERHSSTRYCRGCQEH